jgi:hypothetical protein
MRDVRRLINGLPEDQREVVIMRHYAGMSFKEIADIQDFIAQEREQLNEADKTKMLVVLKIDRDTKMGVVTEVKQALRRASALKIMYANTNVDRIVLP